MGNVADNSQGWLVFTPGGPRVELAVGRQSTPSGLEWHTATALGERTRMAVRHVLVPRIGADVVCTAHKLCGLGGGLT